MFIGDLNMSFDSIAITILISLSGIVYIMGVMIILNAVVYGSTENFLKKPSNIKQNIIDVLILVLLGTSFGLLVLLVSDLNIIIWGITDGLFLGIIMIVIRTVLKNKELKSCLISADTEGTESFEHKGQLYNKNKYTHILYGDYLPLPKRILKNAAEYSKNKISLGKDITFHQAHLEAIESVLKIYEKSKNQTNTLAKDNSGKEFRAVKNTKPTIKTYSTKSQTNNYAKGNSSIEIAEELLGASYVQLVKRATMLKMNPEDYSKYIIKLSKPDCPDHDKFDEEKSQIESIVVAHTIQQNTEQEVEKEEPKGKKGKGCLAFFISGLIYSLIITGVKMSGFVIGALPTIIIFIVIFLIVSALFYIK